MEQTIEQVIEVAEEKMQKAIQSIQAELASIRTGRANPKILDRIIVNYYGTATHLNQMANISVPDPQSLLIQPYDKSAMGDIEKAITISDLGLTPNNDGQVIRINIPTLTEERRKDLTKVVKKAGEEGKVAIRNIRREATDQAKKLEKSENLPEDMVKRQLEDIQKLTDKYSAQVDKMVDEKDKELMSL